MRYFTTALLIAACSMTAAAEEMPFFSNEKAEQLITFGARVGLNTSNYTSSGKYLDDYNENSWGIGFDAGVVCDINFRDYFSIQPGVFYQSRSSNYAYCTILNEDKGKYYSQLGHTRAYYLSIPILASFHFNLADNVKWNVEAGPYFNFRLGSDRFQRSRVSNDGLVGETYDFNVDPSAVDIGIKAGMSLTLFSHYEVGAHYMAGLSDYWQDKKFDKYQINYSGKSKAWVFSIGYNF